jgi:hypothetical protein
MPFDLKSPKKSVKKSKRGPAKKKEGPSINEKMEMRSKKVLDYLLVNKEKLTKTERVNLSNYIFPKTKSVREKLKEKKKISLTKIQIVPNNF